MGKYIETALPLAEINDAAIREKAGKRGHPANLHMWWGRSPEASSLAALAAAIMDFLSETSERDLALIAKTASGDNEALETIRSSLRERGACQRSGMPLPGSAESPLPHKSWDCARSPMT